MRRNILLATLILLSTACTSKQQPVSTDNNDQPYAIAQVDTVNNHDEVIEAETPGPISQVTTIPTFEQAMRLMDILWNDAISPDDEDLKCLDMHCLHWSKSEEDEEGIVFTSGYYARNASMYYVDVEVDEGITYPEARYKVYGPHALILGVETSTDNWNCLYFSDKEDYEAFKASVPAERLEYEYWEFDFDEKLGLYFAYKHCG